MVHVDEFGILQPLLMSCLAKRESRVEPASREMGGGSHRFSNKHLIGQVN